VPTNAISSVNEEPRKDDTFERQNKFNDKNYPPKISKGKKEKLGHRRIDEAGKVR
jgi:hypothetical protein